MTNTDKDKSAIIKQVRPPKPEKECPECLDGFLYRNPQFKEPYGYPYRPAKIECPTCKGIGWIK